MQNWKFSGSGNNNGKQAAVGDVAMDGPATGMQHGFLGTIAHDGLRTYSPLQTPCRAAASEPKLYAVSA
jgi:hypothetical protein